MEPPSVFFSREIQRFVDSTMFLLCPTIFLVIKMCVHRATVAGRSGIQVTPSLGETLSSLASTTRLCASVVALGNCRGVGGWKQGVCLGMGPSTYTLED